MRLKFYVAAILTGASTPAISADLPTIKGTFPAAPIVQEYSWTGPYVGAQVGYAWGNDVTKEYLTATRQFIGLQNYYKPSGFVAGVHAGYNFQFGSLVAGIEADAEVGNVRGGFVDPPVAPFNPGGRGSNHTNFQGSLRARLGYSFGRTLLYATGGGAAAQFESTYINWPGVSERFTKTVLGYTVGAGIEHAVTNYMTLRAEYRFSEFNHYWNHSAVAFPGFSGTQHPRNHTMRIGASYKF